LFIGGKVKGEKVGRKVKGEGLKVKGWRNDLGVKVNG
jgi:hypothetical protein